MLKGLLSGSSLAATICSASLAMSALADSPTSVDVPPGDLAAALDVLAKQASANLVYEASKMQGLKTQGVSGHFTPREAVEKLLEGTSLRLSTDEATGAMMIAAPKTSERATSQIGRARESGASIQLAQNTEGRKGDEQGASGFATDGVRQSLTGSAVSIEELVVTGSHIRNVENFSSPVLRFNRVDIEQGGFATVQQLVQALPQNLNNVSDMGTGGLNGEPSSYTYNGAGLNLRGLGTDSTLVLLDGQRIPAAGDGSFVDLSLIPLNAVERIEVLTDGASAIYGSDAVGGVVNLVLRKNFEGAESRLRYGTVTQGSHEEFQAGQMLGQSWDSGQALVNYEFYRKTDLAGSDRDFIQPSEWLRDYNAIPGQRRHGGLARFSQRLGDAVELSSTLSYGRRDSKYNITYGGRYSEVDSEVEQYGGALGISLDLPRDWQLRLSGLFGNNESSEVQFTPDRAPSDFGHRSRMWSLELAADGVLGRASGGEIRAAVGSQFRNERLVADSLVAPMQLDRDVAAVYAEVRVPWVSSENGWRGVYRLDTTLAGRFEDYSDFGSTFNPKIGLSWAPARALNVRATWGTSFKAPLLKQMNPADFLGAVFYEAFADASGQVTAMRLYGSGTNLSPEESTNWTAGLDFAPSEGVDLSATYFNIDYRDRIRGPFPSGYDFFGVLMDPIYGAVVTRNPDPAQVQAFLGHPRMQCYAPGFTACTRPPSADDVQAIVDGRLTNLASVRMDGVDFSASYRWRNALGEWGLQLGGSKLLSNREQLISGTPTIDQMNDVWRPVDLRMRGSISFARGPFGALAFINYTDAYADTRASNVAGPLQRSEVGSWTTLDLNLRYSFSWLNGSPTSSLTLAAVNVADRDPPYVGSVYGLNFDGVNANPLGRFVALQIATTW